MVVDCLLCSTTKNAVWILSKTEAVEIGLNWKLLHSNPRKRYLITLMVPVSNSEKVGLERTDQLFQISIESHQALFHELLTLHVDMVER